MSTITFPARPSKLSVEVEDFRRWRSNTLFGFCTILIPEVRLRLVALTVHRSHSRRCVGPPGEVIALAEPQGRA
jgi:hypothetical protein